MKMRINKHISILNNFDHPGTIINQGTLWYVASIFDMRESVKCVIILDAYPLYAQESGLYLFFCFVFCFQTQLIINRRKQQLKANDEENEVKEKR